MAYIPDIIPPDERGRYAKGNMGKRVGFGARPAVVFSAGEFANLFWLGANVLLNRECYFTAGLDFGENIFGKTTTESLLQ